MTKPVPTALLAAFSAVVADALDSLGLRSQVVDPRVTALFPGARVVGRAYPVEVVTDFTMPAEPYEGEMSALSAMGPGDVGVYSVEAGSRAAAWGELFSCAAIGRGVMGALVDGCVRDQRQIAELGFPVFSVSTSPFDTLGRARVARYGHPVDFGGVAVHRGDVVIADSDGIVVVPASEVDQVAAFVANKHTLEQSARDDLMSGMGIRDVWAKYGVF